MRDGRNLLPLKKHIVSYPFYLNDEMSLTRYLGRLVKKGLGEFSGAYWDPDGEKPIDLRRCMAIGDQIWLKAIETSLVAKDVL